MKLCYVQNLMSTRTTKDWVGTSYLILLYSLLIQVVGGEYVPPCRHLRNGLLMFQLVYNDYELDYALCTVTFTFPANCQVAMLHPPPKHPGVCNNIPHISATTAEKLIKRKPLIVPHS